MGGIAIRAHRLQSARYKLEYKHFTQAYRFLTAANERVRTVRPVGPTGPPLPFSRICRSLFPYQLGDVEVDTVKIRLRMSVSSSVSCRLRESCIAVREQEARVETACSYGPACARDGSLDM